MKYGFSKSQLMDFCQKLEIQYVHIPELGIESSKRKDLEGQQDYNQLFEEYDRETLPHRREYLQKIQEMIQLNKRVALTCFEALPQQCHRARVAKALKLMTHYELTHL